MTKLLNEEELRDAVTQLRRERDAHQMDESDYTDAVVMLIQSQKQAHADMVIGEDEQRLENLTGVDHDRFTRNRLRAKQRERNMT
ncbi:hypothetical protein [Mycolicibacterium wolinskyi]|uniref:hypothetical protein n=1 Tax=Mycolicibacterium wolinskyi TaxID=59750 RepID=UPI00391786FC